MSTWFILWPFEIFYGHWEYFVVIWYIFPRFGMLYLEKSGNPGFFNSISTQTRKTQEQAFAPWSSEACKIVKL
jgi:hypothetical protein